VRVLAPAWGTARGATEVDGVEVYRFQFLPPRWQTLTMEFGGVPATLRRAPWRLLQLPAMLAAATALSIRMAGEVDVLHAHWLPNLLPLAPAAWSRRRAVRLVTLWGSDVEWFERARWLRPAFRAVLHGADGVVAINDHMQALFSDSGRTRDRLRLIPSGVDTDLFRPRDRTQLRLQLKLPTEAVVGLFVGSLIPRKGVDIALDAFARVNAQRALLVVVGEGSERPALAALAHERGVTDRVRFVGASSLAEVADWMSAADIFLLPSRYEGRPNVILEAQASGLAIIASDIPGCRDLIEAGITGLLTPTDDVATLADSLSTLVGDVTLRAKLGRNARDAIRQRGYSWDACAEKYRQFYQDLISNRRCVS
jgi:glycosyltransferase involved in cell wall biosynthesis